MGKFLKRLTFILKFWKFIPFLKEYFLSHEVKSRYKVIGVLWILAYAFFPFDIIPDFFSIFGIFDDIVVTTFVLNRIVKMAPESLKVKYKLIS